MEGNGGVLLKNCRWQNRKSELTIISIFGLCGSIHAVREEVEFCYFTRFVGNVLEINNAGQRNTFWQKRRWHFIYLGCSKSVFINFCSEWESRKDSYVWERAKSKFIVFGSGTAEQRFLGVFGSTYSGESSP